MSETEDQTTVDTGSRVGFRDIYRAVGESEVRITSAIERAVAPLTGQVADHEVRVRQLENYAAALTQEERAGALQRITSLEKQMTTAIERRAGRDDVVGASKSFIIAVVVIVNAIVAVIATILDHVQVLTP